MTKKIHLMVTAFRDGFQSVYGSRVLSRDYLPAVEAARRAGIFHFEAGGGASFQSAFFYANENAFDVMDAFRAAAGPDANLQTLARGINVVGLESQPSDVIRLHAQLFAKHGVSTIRNFDALNDVQNLVFSGQCIVEAGLKHEVVVTMMGLPPGCDGAHTPEFYLGVLRQILDADIPYHSVCFKDASGTATPSVVGETIRRSRELLGSKVSLRFHTHETAGIGLAAYLSAIDAGADALDVSLAPVSGGTCQPDIATLWHALRGQDVDLGMDIGKVLEAEEVLKECMRDYDVPPEARAVEPLIPFSPMPGGALTANTQMMRDHGTLPRLPEVIAAMGDTVRRGGFGTSVTPVSQFYFQQAYNNVFLGPWKKLADGYGKMVLGYFGRTPVAPDSEVVRLASEQLGLPPTTESPLALNDADPEKGIAPARAALESEKIAVTDENVFIVATCGGKGVEFLKGEARVMVRKKAAPAADPTAEPSELRIQLGEREYRVVLDDGHATVNGVPYAFTVSEDMVSPAARPSTPGGGTSITAPMPGSVLRIPTTTGKSVRVGDVVIVLEAMKMEVELKAAVSGVLEEVAVAVGSQVKAGQTLARIR
ncbi:MAG: biotin/lipoyl-containing protein [Candidatus Bipolaricaulia bacterium]